MKKQKKRFQYLLLSFLLLAVTTVMGQIDTIQSVDTQEAGSLNPDATDANRADIMVHTTASDADSYEAFVKFDISGVNTAFLSSASVVTWGGQHNPSGESMVAEYWIDMYGSTTTDWPDPFTWNSSRSMDKGTEVLGSANIQEQAAGYTFSSEALVNWIKAQKAAGASEITLRYNARDEQEWDIWLSGTWKGQELILEYDYTPTTIHSSNTQEAGSASPDAEDSNRADIMVHNTAGDADSYMAFVKFDISMLNTDGLVGASVETWGGQHNPSGESMVAEYMIDMYGCNTTEWPDPFTWNSVSDFDIDDEVLGSDNIQEQAEGYTFGGDALVDWIVAKKIEGATEITLVYKARDEQAWDIWLSGTWKGQDLMLEYGIPEPTQLHSIDTQEAGSASPDSEDSNRADIMVLSSSDDSNTYEAYVKFDISRINTDRLVGAEVITYGGQHNPSGESMVAEYWIDMYGCNTTEWPDPFTWNSTRDFDVDDQVLGSDNVQGFQGDYTFGGDALVDWIVAKKAEGAREITLVYKARDPQAWDIWLSGTWKGEDLYLEYGTPEPTQLHSIDTQEAGSASPDSEDSNRADIMVLASSDDSNTYEAYVKFDISRINTDRLVGAEVITYGGQHNPSGESMVAEYWIDMYGCNTTEWPSPFTWNSTRDFDIDDQVLGSDNVQDFQGDYTFGGDALVDWIVAKKAEGAKEITLVYKARDPQAWDIWLSGTWKGEDLYLEYGTPEPTQLHSIDTQEAGSASPDAEDSNRADIMVLASSDDSNTYEAYVKFDISRINTDRLVGAEVITYGGQHNPSGESMVAEYWIDMYGCNTTEWPSPFTWNSTRDFDIDDQVLGSDNVQDFQGDYTFGGDALVDWIVAKKAEGAKEITLVYKARDPQAWDIWLSGTWKGEDLYLEYGAPQPDSLHSIDTQEAGSASPDAEDSNRADIMVLSSSDDSNTYEAYVKFDISRVSTDSLIGAAVVTYGGQHNPSGESMVAEYWIDMYGCNTTEWPDPFTWNTTRNFDIDDQVLGSDNVQGFQGDYTFGGKNLVNWIKAKKAEGAKEVAFVYKARDAQEWDIWLSGTWKGEDLMLEYGVPESPDSLHSLDTQEAGSLSPDATDVNRADIMVHNTSGDSDSYEAYVKFDISKVITDSLVGASVVTWAGQHNPSGQARIAEYMVDMYGCNTTDWPDPFTWNSTRSFDIDDEVLGSDNIQEQAEGYTFGGDALVDWIKAKKAEGATEVAFVYKAREEQEWDIWLSGTWKGQDLLLEYGDPTVSVSEIEQVSVMAYPNPVSDRLTISNLSSGSNVALFSLSGSKVIEVHNGSNSQISLGMRNLKSGVYLLRITSDSNHMQSIKVIKK